MKKLLEDFIKEKGYEFEYNLTNILSVDIESYEIDGGVCVVKFEYKTEFEIWDDMMLKLNVWDVLSFIYNKK